MFSLIVCYIWPINRTLLGATIPGQKGAGSNGNEGVLHIPQISKAEVLPSDDLTLFDVWGVLLLCRDAVSVFYSSSRTGLYLIFKEDNFELEFDSLIWIHQRVVQEWDNVNNYNNIFKKKEMVKSGALISQNR